MLKIVHSINYYTFIVKIQLLLCRKVTCMYNNAAFVTSYSDF